MANTNAKPVSRYLMILLVQMTSSELQEGHRG